MTCDMFAFHLIYMLTYSLNYSGLGRASHDNERIISSSLSAVDLSQLLNIFI